MAAAWIDIAYLVAAILFIYGLKGLTRPATAVRGNQLAAAGMLIAVVFTLFDQNIVSYGGILLAILIGSGIGAFIAIKVRMEQMPELVAILNGVGGGAAFLVAGAEIRRRVAIAWEAAGGAEAGYEKFAQTISLISMPGTGTATALSGLIGAITLTGSLVAFAKLAELKLLQRIPPIPQQRWVMIGLAVITTFFFLVTCNNPGTQGIYWLMVFFALGLGYCLTISIGGADMPVVISTLNASTGLAAAGAGFMLQNNVLIIAGALVGSAGTLLTRMMCRAMNRSLKQVLFGAAGAVGKFAAADEVYANVKSTTGEEIAMLLSSAQRVVIVPGYGMAVAQAQHAVRDLTNLLRKSGVDVVFGIHPVAGRMPGHMNVLLAEADISYDLLKEMEEVNESIQQTDVCLVVGANDIVNPEARTNPDSPIAGMPVINADLAKTCVIVKRSLSPGFANIPNPLFAAENSLMFYADGKDGILEIVHALKA